MCKIEVFDALKYRVEVDRGGTRKYLNVDGLLHRVDGPAIENSSGLREWWLNGVELSKFEFEQAVGTHNV